MIVIGEKINGAIPSIKEAIANRDAELIRQRAIAQDQAGADYIDCAPSTAPELEYDAMVWLIEQIQAGLCFGQENNGLKINEEPCRETAALLAARFISKLSELRRILATDVEAAYYGDPAATCFGEIISCYPAIRAISNYRIAHELLILGVPLIPRIITEMAHSETGIDIHPGAQIGHHFTIDHGTGVVIGATCIIGNNVKLYQGVTLGAKSFPLDENGNPIKGIPRHPILEDDVIVYSNATILGRVTIGKGATVGGNIWVTEDVPAGARIVQHKR